MVETVAGAEHHDDVGGLSAQLQAPTAAANLDEDRRAPAIAIAASGQAFAVGAAEAQGKTLLAGHDGDALRALEHFLRDALVGSLHHFLEDLIRALDASGIVVKIGSGKGSSRQRERANSSKGARRHE